MVKLSDVATWFFIVMAGFVTVVLAVRTVESGWAWEPFFLGVICGSLFQTGVLILVSVFRGWRR